MDGGGILSGHGDVDGRGMYVVATAKYARVGGVDHCGIVRGYGDRPGE